MLGDCNHMVRTSMFTCERDVYIQQVSLLFRRHGLSGFVDSLEQF
jgi:hypothetical protein